MRPDSPRHAARHQMLTQGVPQVRFWHEYHFGVAPKEFLRSTPKSELVQSKACFYKYTWLTDKGCFKRTIDTNSS